MILNIVEKIKSWLCTVRYRRLLLRSLDGNLNASEQRVFSAHLERCERCRVQYARQLFASRLIALYSLPDESPTGKPNWVAGTTTGNTRADRKRVFSTGRLVTSFAATIVLAVLAGLAWRYWPAPEVTWNVIRLSGNPTIGQRQFTRADKLGTGETLETDADSRAMIQVGLIGQVEIDSDSRVRLLSAAPNDHRLALEKGRLHAFILAPPRLFSVETASATAVDLGCAYTLDVNESGEGLLRVTSGWVAFQLKGREALVPAGARCNTRSGRGPGTPFMEDATERFQTALERFDFTGGGGAEIGVILQEARAKDSLTLWHLLTRVQGDERAKMYERLASFAPLPAGVSREGILRLDQKMLDVWREKLEYISIGIDPAKFPVAPGSLKPAGAMIDARFNHTATLLKDGRVLLAGGREQAENILASAELFDPASGEFSPTEAMKSKRVGHTATLLPNGKVLVAGGSDNNFFVGALSSAELYDPATGAFTPTGNMLVPRLAHQATLLKDGRVLVTGGQGNERANHASAEFYDPATGVFTPAATMTERRADHTATLLADGRVLLTGGGRQMQTDVCASAEVYDPRKNHFTPVGNMSVVRYKHSAMLLPNGKVVIIGGANAKMWLGRYISAEIFDPTTAKFTPTGNMNTARYKIRDAVVLLRDGKILVAGGSTRVEVFDPDTGLFAAVKGGLATTKYYATATLLADGKVLIVGGYSLEATGNMPANSVAWIYQPE